MFEKINSKVSQYRKKISLRMILALLILVFAVVEILNISVKIDPRYSLSKGLEPRGSLQLQEKVLPKEGVILPIEWRGFGEKMIEIGVIDSEKFEGLYISKGGLEEYEKSLLFDKNTHELVINEQNSGAILNLLWAFGLVNKNSILEEGPMQDKQYGGAQNFASTGGWSLSAGDAMDYYSAEKLVVLNEKQQKLVEEVAKNIYRPCCGNSTYFPDCNHGMAMLGFLEIMAEQGATEQEMYDAALLLNSFWFPQTYMTIAKYFNERGVDWEKVDAKIVLGNSYSSAIGYQDILQKVEPPAVSGGGSCGV
ncbi:MAG: hypothetical protein A3H51_00575 [Candidatus Spechtbacteria bacterium RIFCSPLOWO2_02_FULL_38_8]|uniref:Uncharacterized protein n=1 Tax=Candidatus Spechtbacteria bacterium RIFCSPLOWO2_02_FULL_38_8 TaxID=1802164 RepID=A0A1G2HJR5_9BACT|nr:MAG: hypothetical protein A3H51_00575 [Candidatus Spechtbacteria bacterium RIFCSPLOWO2_02_FULL_38_8]